MEEIDDLLTEALRPLVEQCSPLRVKVSLRCVEDRYYIDFDGTATFIEDSLWESYWGSFELYVKHVLKSNNFDTSAVNVNNLKAEALIGTLFGFLINERKGDA